MIKKTVVTSIMKYEAACKILEVLTRRIPIGEAKNQSRVSINPW